MATFNGAAGVKAYTAACAAEFAGSRMCRSDEILQTDSWPATLNATQAWVAPTIVAWAGGSAVDASGFVLYSSLVTLSCSAWSGRVSSGYPDYGLTLTDAGVWGANACDTIQSVACCAPRGVTQQTATTAPQAKASGFISEKH